MTSLTTNLDTLSFRASKPAILLGDSSKLQIALSETGLVLSIRNGNTLVSRTLGNDLDGGLFRIYLRIHRDAAIEVYELIGPQGSLSHFTWEGCVAQWTGSLVGLEVNVNLSIDSESSRWFWEVRLCNESVTAVEVDVVCAQDVGLADVGAVTNNEAYVSHYVDITPLSVEGVGTVLCYRQNLAQSSGEYPWLLLACLTGAKSYATDGFDFYGNAYRSVAVPEALNRRALPSRVRQYEFACASFASQPVELKKGDITDAVFAGQFLSNHPDATSETDTAVVSSLSEAWSSKNKIDDLSGRPIEEKSMFQTAPLYRSSHCSEAMLRRFFKGEWRHVEEGLGGVHSFFTENDTHVVTLAKEVSIDRPHGSLLVGNAEPGWDSDTLSTTVYMNGVFGAHTVVGNTSFHRMQTLPRDPFGLSRVAGQRIFVEDSGQWRQLGLPSFFSMSRDVCRWFYVQNDETIIVEVGLNRESSAIYLKINSVGSSLRFKVTNDLILGADESVLCGSSDWNPDDRCLKIMSNDLTVAFAFFIPLGQALPSVATGEAIEASSDQLVVLSFEKTREVELTIGGSFRGVDKAVERASSASKCANSTVSKFWSDLNLDLSLSLPHEACVSRLDDALKWFSHNAMIHYSSPHGLEQYSGAAWGTRDVCQGPFEYFLSVGRYDLARGILVETFSRQFKHSGDWPQWFMLDGYSHIVQEHSHGDIVVWPLKALAVYLLSTGDFDVLNESIPFIDRDSNSLPAESLLSHINATLDRIESEFVPDTALIRYGNGDWDDSLQPVNQDLANRLVSGWTVGLLSQALSELASALSRFESSGPQKRVAALAERVRADFRKYLFLDGEVAGFILFDQNYENSEPLLHPNDKLTGIKHRLIPMTRSIIAGLVTADEAVHQIDLIHKHLYSPDGVRLMGRPAPYRGGVESFFRRAESAAFFGREIGLQYVHAHLRYAESLSMLGRGVEFYEALMTICPIQLEKTVPNAAARQSNHYFSSSDADVLNRKDAAERFDQILTGEIKAKGGWRVYSSGPGIYIGLVIQKLLGLRSHADAWEFDPVMPKFLNGLSVRFRLGDHSVVINYEVSESECGPIEILCGDLSLASARMENPYRKGGLLVEKAALETALQAQNHTLTVRM